MKGQERKQEIERYKKERKRRKWWIEIEKGTQERKGKKSGKT